jgi:hypothetical protein
MRSERVRQAADEAAKFLRIAEMLLKSGSFTWEISGTKLSGMVRRSSLDLTRALADMRKSK